MSDFVVNKENLLKGGWYIEITNEKHCEQVQLALFELGVFWRDGDENVSHVYHKLLGFDEQGGGFWVCSDPSEVTDHQNITNEFNAHVEEKQLEKNASKKPHEMLTPYCRVQWLDGRNNVFLYKHPSRDTYVFSYLGSPRDFIGAGVSYGEHLDSDCSSLGISHIYARPFASLDEATNEELIDPSMRGELVWQRDMVNPVEKQLKQKLAELSEQMKEAQRAVEEAQKQLDEYVASKQ